MKTKTPIFALVVFSLSILFVSCRPNHRGHDINIQQSAVDTLALSHNIITENVNKYPREIDLFENKAVTYRLKKLAGEAYDSIVNNFQKQSPVVTVNGIYEFTGCGQPDCQAFLTTILYDAHTDNFNIIIKRNGKAQVYTEEKGPIVIPYALRGQ